MNTKYVCPDCRHQFNANNHNICPKCGFNFPKGKPESILAEEELSESADLVIFSTTSEIPGKVIGANLGLVFGAGNAAWTIETTASRSVTALGKAEEQLRREAARLSADAVIGITFSMDSSGSALNRSQAITLLGTAVKFK